MLVRCWLLLAAVAFCRGAVKEDYEACQAKVFTGANSTAPGAQVQYCYGLRAFMQHDYAQALTSLNRAAAQGNSGALALLGYFYEKGHGVPADPKRAFDYYLQSAKLGNSDGMHELARCYRYGIGVPRNEAEAERWFNQGAAHGTERGYQPPPGQVQPDQADFDAGVRLYKAGDFAQAFPLFQRAANAGNARAELQVGSQYERGEGVTKNYAEAVRWYAKSAAAGDPTAQKNLGQMYEDGLGTAENWTLAAEWYQKSAAQGAEDGEFALGRCYEFGIGVPQNRATAIEWFRRAGAQGNSQADYFAKWLSEPTNFVGFRNKTEHNYVMDRLHYAGDFLGGDPTGVVFRSSEERDRFLVAFKSSAVFHEAQTQWSMHHAQYQSCISNHGGNCQSPGPPPKP
jgi:TPR repeat protein